MKNFNYTARDTSGTIKHGSVLAADRNAVLRELTAKGMHPISVFEGEAASRSSNVKKTVAITTAFLGFICLVVSLTRVVVSDQPHSTAPAKKKATSSSTIETSNQKIVELEKKTQKKVIAATNILVTSMKQVETHTNIQPYVSQNQTNQQELIKAAVARRPFKYGTEQVMSLVFNTQLGDNPIPVPKIGKVENIQEVLNTDITLYDDDPEKVERAKRNVAMAKQLLKEYVEKGGNVDEFVQYYREELYKIHLEWKESQKEFIQLLKAGDMAAAETYLKKQNKAFEEKGIKPLVIPPQYRAE